MTNETSDLSFNNLTPFLFGNKMAYQNQHLAEDAPANHIVWQTGKFKICYTKENYLNICKKHREYWKKKRDKINETKNIQI